MKNLSRKEEKNGNTRKPRKIILEKRLRLMSARVAERLPTGAAPDEGIGFRYAPKRYALRAPLGLRSSRRPHRGRGEKKAETD